MDETTSRTLQAAEMANGGRFDGEVHDVTRQISTANLMSIFK